MITALKVPKISLGSQPCSVKLEFHPIHQEFSSQSRNQACSEQLLFLWLWQVSVTLLDMHWMLTGLGSSDRATTGPPQGHCSQTHLKKPQAQFNGQWITGEEITALLSDRSCKPGVYSKIRSVTYSYKLQKLPNPTEDNSGNRKQPTSQGGCCIFANKYSSGFLAGARISIQHLPSYWYLDINFKNMHRHQIG